MRIEELTYPVGSVVGYQGTSPADWIPCDGRSFRKEEFPELFAAIESIHGQLDSNSATVPNVNGHIIKSGAHYPLVKWWQA